MVGAGNPEARTQRERPVGSGRGGPGLAQHSSSLMRGYGAPTSGKRHDPPTIQGGYPLSELTSPPWFREMSP